MQEPASKDSIDIVRALHGARDIEGGSILEAILVVVFSGFGRLLGLGQADPCWNRLQRRAKVVAERVN